MLPVVDEAAPDLTTAIACLRPDVSWKEKEKELIKRNAVIFINDWFITSNGAGSQTWTTLQEAEATRKGPGSAVGLGLSVAFVAAVLEAGCLYCWQVIGQRGSQKVRVCFDATLGVVEANTGEQEGEDEQSSFHFIH